MRITKNQTILIISNEPEKLENLSVTLQEMGYKLLFAGDGQEGFRLIRRKSPDIVISEIKLPVISGLELCRRIRADKQLHATPLIFLSDSPNISINQVEIRLVGADDWINASADSETLARKIKSVIDQKRLENDLRQFSQQLRGKHLQITNVMKGAFDSLTAANFENKTAASDIAHQQEFEEKILGEMELGINIIGWMSYLLEEHVKAFADLDDARYGKDFADCQKSESENYKPDYKYVTYEMIGNESKANKQAAINPTETE